MLVPTGRGGYPIPHMLVPQLPAPQGGTAGALLSTDLPLLRMPPVANTLRTCSLPHSGQIRTGGAAMG